jgi:hypothetical protein
MLLKFSLIYSFFNYSVLRGTFINFLNGFAVGFMIGKMPFLKAFTCTATEGLFSPTFKVFNGLVRNPGWVARVLRNN